MNIKTSINYKKSMKPIIIKNNDDINIMSFNIRCISKDDTLDKYYKVRMPLIRKLLEENNPDVIGFQEVKVKQFKYLLKILKGFDFEYQKRDDKKEGEANPIFVKKNKFTLINKSTFWLSDTYEFMSNTFKGSCNRICSYIRLKENKTNKEFFVFNTHLDHRSEDARIKGILLIKKVIKEILKVEIPYLIIGDMNDFYESKPINELFLDLIDASKIINDKDEVTYQDYGRQKQKIDFIALSKNINELSYQVITKKYNNIFPSDHYPIEVKIRL